jgi:hypothetical protein
MGINNFKKSGGKDECTMYGGIIPLSPPQYSSMYEWHDTISYTFKIVEMKKGK